MIVRSLLAAFLLVGLLPPDGPVGFQMVGAPEYEGAEVSGRVEAAASERDGSSRDGCEGETVIATAEGPHSLGAGALRVPLKYAASATSSGGAALGARVGSLGRGRRIRLVVKGLRAREQPGVVYHLYLDLPEGARPARDDPHYVGTLNFYDASGFGPEDSRSKVFRSFDVTEVVMNLRARELLAEQTTVTILPSGVPKSSSKPEIESLELVEQ